MPTFETKLAPQVKQRVFWRLAIALPYVVPTGLFIASLYIGPSLISDSGFGFLVFRSMLEGGIFNGLMVPDPADIDRDIVIFQTWWSPGQYLVPGFFVWLGTDYGLALSLTVLLATVLGISGWAQLALSFGVSASVFSVFVLSLVTFRYATLPFLIYNGGEVLLFGVAPWSLYCLQRVIEKPPLITFSASILLSVVLFFAKLTGLIVFAVNALVVSLFSAFQKRSVTPALSVWTACLITGSLFVVFWLQRGDVPGQGSEFSFNWPAIWFPITGIAFSGFSGFDLLTHPLLSPFTPVFSNLAVAGWVLGPLGLSLMVAVWCHLRTTRYRTMAGIFFAIAALYAFVFMWMYLSGAQIGFQERSFRYVGIFFFLLLLVAVDQYRSRVVKASVLVFVGALAFYGLGSYIVGAREVMRGDYYDPLSGTTQTSVPPAVLRYLRGEMQRDNWRRAIVVLPSATAAIALPHFRIIVLPPEFISGSTTTLPTWRGRVDKIFVIAQEKMLSAGQVDVVLNAFADYPVKTWRSLRFEGTVVYSQ